eukprot:TRINITY_DN1326_c0_g1_i6.p2 TRINITY_DN1326_c0_g1~~TRINITY_DN1326_c0_g1_i6.p2  ORF type:complete len:137 (-),score=31.81 TRINITY_DN1326_c0_g1_i6:298-708(-)
MKAFGFEFLWSFVLVTVVLNVATTRDAAGNSFYGLAIGGTIFVGAFMGGDLSGACFNPAIGIGLACVAYGIKNVSSPLWIYVVAPLIASVVSVLYFRATNYKEYILTHQSEKKGLTLIVRQTGNPSADEALVTLDI